MSCCIRAHVCLTICPILCLVAPEHTFVLQSVQSCALLHQSSCLSYNLSNSVPCCIRAQVCPTICPIMCLVASEHMFVPQYVQSCALLHQSSCLSYNLSNRTPCCIRACVFPTIVPLLRTVAQELFIILSPISVQSQWNGKRILSCRYAWITNYHFPSLHPDIHKLVQTK